MSDKPKNPRNSKKERKPREEIPEDKPSKPKLVRQNSATLRKYGNVYENFRKEQHKKESEHDLSQKMEKMKLKEKKDSKAVKLPKEGEEKKDKKEKKEKKEKKLDDKPKRPLNSYQIFFKEQRLAGKTPTEIGILWKKVKETH